MHSQTAEMDHLNDIKLVTLIYFEADLGSFTDITHIYLGMRPDRFGLEKEKLICVPCFATKNDSPTTLTFLDNFLHNFILGKSKSLFERTVDGNICKGGIGQCFRVGQRLDVMINLGRKKKKNDYNHPPPKISKSITK